MPYTCSTPSRPVRAFTLVELLVVIGIIAVLVSILLPSLSRARRQAQDVVCKSNLRQVAMTMLLYANSNKGVFPGTGQGPAALDWCGYAVWSTITPRPKAHPITMSPLARYMTTDKILICPTGERPNNLYDYTMIMRMGGIRPGCHWRVSYPVYPGALSSTRAYFDGMPVLVEEHELFNNNGVLDGSFGNADQLTARHKGRANIAYADGSVGSFVSPHGKVDTAVEIGDLVCNHLILHANNRTYSVGSAVNDPFGWVNKPK